MRSNKLSFFRVIPFVLTVGILTFFWSAQSMAELFSSETKDPLPEFSLSTLNSNTKHLTNKTLAGLGHVVLLNVWGSWCGYCRSEHAMLMKISNKYHVPIYGIDLKDSPEESKAYLASEGNPYAMVGLDMDGDASSALDVFGTPQTLIIDKHGLIRYRFTGPIDQNDWTNDLLPLIKKYEMEN